MAGKRSAVSELNHDNWDQDDEPDEAGSFKKASQDVLHKRIIKTAKRRNPISSNAETGAKSVFGSFSGFGKSTTPSTAFAFLNNITAPKDNSPSVNGVNNSPSVFTSPTSISSPSKLPDNKTSNEKEDEYYPKLKGLNESVSNWIKKHVDSNPFVNLKPIFKDYEKYFDELENIKSSKTDDKQATLASLNSKSTDDTLTYKNELSSFVFKTSDKPKEVEKKLTVPPQFSFGSNLNKKESNVTFGAKPEKTESTLFALNKNAKSDNTTATPVLNFGSKSVTTTGAPTFSFSADTKTSSSNISFGSPNSKPFTFSNVAKPANNDGQKDEQHEEDEEPPKVEFTPVVEDGHTYTVRCKVFVKNQGTFGDRGVGMLYLKPVSDSEKTQLVVRADTNLGNLLCNFILSESIPMKRMGKKDVMLVCLPTPDVKPPPIPILLRVKSPEQADELLAELEKHKK